MSAPGLAEVLKGYRVVELSHVLEEGMIVLLDLGWAEMWTADHGVENQPYHGDNSGLSEEAAAYLADKRVKLVRGDVPTIDGGSDHDEPAQRILLPRGCWCWRTP